MLVAEILAVSSISFFSLLFQLQTTREEKNKKGSTAHISAATPLCWGIPSNRIQSAIRSIFPGESQPYVTQSMSFRRNSSQSHEWKKWVAANGSELLAAGVPDWLFTDELRWIGFLEEGCDLVTGWSPSVLDPQNARALHSFIQSEYGDQDYRGTLHDIEVHLSKSAT